MLKHPGHHLGDVWFYVEGDVAHAYYLVCPESVPKFTWWDIGHATSRDLVNWEIHPLALEHGPKEAWNARLATGSVFRKDGRYGMAYTAHRYAETGIAWSDDLFRWIADPRIPATSIDFRHYSPAGTGQRPQRHWRDPFVLEDGGRWYSFVCAEDRRAPEGARGAVGVAVLDGDRWRTEPPLHVEPFCQEMECPQIVVRDGVYYLLFSTLAELLAPQARRGDLAGEIPWGGTFVMTAESLLGPYRAPAAGAMVTRPIPEVPYAAQAVRFGGRDYLLGTCVPEGILSYMSDPYSIEFTPSGVRLLSP